VDVKYYTPHKFKLKTMVSSKRYAGTKAIVKAMNQIMQALSPVSQIKTTVPACENNFG